LGRLIDRSAPGNAFCRATQVTDREVAACVNPESGKAEDAMSKTIRYGFGKSVERGFDDAVRRVTELLAQEGFGVLTEIDVAATMKKKLDHDMPPYKILGACNPGFARRAIEAEPEIGMLLPCNVVVREDPAGAVRVEFMDPGLMAEVVANPAVQPIAAEVRGRLERVMNAL
jgi:uncharacterized protein (DUF302 family)